jgi:tetratricopeptide (TPR) repeat protein
MTTPRSSPTQELLNHTLDFCDGCLNRQDFTAAWQALCRAVNLAPTNPHVLSHRGRLALFLKDNESAQRDFAAALKFDPRCSAALSGLARYHFQQSKQAEAEITADRALAIDPADEDALVLKAELQAMRCKPRPRGASSMNSRAISVDRESRVPNTGETPGPGFAYRQEPTELRSPEYAGRSQFSDAGTDHVTPPPTRCPNEAWAPSTPLAHVSLAAAPKPIFTFAKTRSENPAANGSISAPPREVP